MPPVLNCRTPGAAHGAPRTLEFPMNDGEAVATVSPPTLPRRHHPRAFDFGRPRGSATPAAHGRSAAPSWARTRHLDRDHGPALTTQRADRDAAHEHPWQPADARALRARHGRDRHTAAPEPSVAIDVELRGLPKGSAITRRRRARGRTDPRAARDGRNRVIPRDPPRQGPVARRHHSSASASYDVFRSTASLLPSPGRERHENRQRHSRQPHKRHPSALRRLDF